MMEHSQYLDQSTNLSAEVEPFIPRSDVGNMFAEQMIHQPSSGQLPHYLTSCYPFVQDQSDGGQRMDQGSNYQGFYQDRDVSGWPTVPPVPHNVHFSQQMPQRFSTPPPQGPPPNLPVPSAHSTPVYSYHAGPPPFPPPTQPYPGMGHPQYPQQLYFDNQIQSSSQQSKIANQQSRREGSGRKSADSKKSSSKKSGRRSIGIQMEVGPGGEEENDPAQLVDNAQQTDFPPELASKTLSEKPSPLRKITRTARHRRRAATAAADPSVSCDSSDNNGDEADVDSDSGYYSPKHQISRRNNTVTSGVSTREDQHEVGTGTGIPNSYPGSNLSPQRIIYLHSQAPMNPQSNYYPVHPNSFMTGPPGPGHLLRLPSSGTPPLLMPPPIRPVQARQHQAIAIANFKSRSSWEQEILKAHNVAPIAPPPFFNSRQPFPGQNRYYPGGGPQQRWRYPGPTRQARGRGQGSYSQGSSAHPRNQDRAKTTNSSNNPASLQNGGAGTHHDSINSGTGHGMLRLNPSTAPSHLLQQNPPQLTDEDFPGLQPSAASSENVGKSTAVLSYSAAVQSKPRPVPDISISEDSPIKNLIEPVDNGQGKGSRRRRKKTERAAKAAAEEYAEISQEHENIKKQLSKKAVKHNKSHAPQLDLAEMLSKLEQQKPTEPMNKSFSSPENVHQRSFGKIPAQSSLEMSPHNPLDSTAPLKKRGKEREIPKVKKPSALKKVILKEREEKKNNRIVSLTTETNPDYDIPSLPSPIFNGDSTPKDASAENNTSEAEASSSGATHSNTQSPLTVSISGNSSPVVPANMPKIHSRRYREYCCQVLDKQIDETCTIILQKLVQFQERMYQKDPIKAKSRRRFVLGLREVTKHLKLKKLRCVLISPNLEKIQSKGGLDDALQNILQLCKTQSVPYVFALGRCAMGRAVSKLVPVSIIGIFDYSGVEDHHKHLLELVDEAQKKYQEMLTVCQQEASEVTTPPVVPASAKRFAHMGHSRNPSAASCVSFCSMISEPISEMNPSEGTSWRNMMDVTDENSPTPALSPPPENIAEDDIDDGAEDPKVANDGGKDMTEKQVEISEDQDDYEEESSQDGEDGEESSRDSYLNALDNSGSLTSDDRQTGEAGLDKSFSTVSTVVARQGKMDTASDKSATKLSHATAGPAVGAAITSIVEHPPPSTSDTTARINSWLEAATSSVHDLEIDDSSSPASDLKQDQEEVNNQEEEDFHSANEEEQINDS